uniref:thiamine-phosphate kinase n=1 Tax=Candidatus Electrothrix sp. TaxID=2170559 RepID=UPI0040573D84
MKERDLIQHIKELTTQKADGLVQGIGDDCAVVTKDQENVWLLTMDTLLESVHFDCSWHPPYLVGRKAVSVNVSDIAAMGGKPVFVLLSLGLPKNFDPEWVSTFNKGINEACSQYGCLLIGGDTVCSPEKVSLTLTLIGESPQDQVVYRHGACPGDNIWVSGALGYAAAGLDYFRTGKGHGAPCLYETSSQYPSEIAPCITAHLDPEARTGLGKALAQAGCIHAMMDLSDGLATDLAHLCQQSRVGAQIKAEKLPGFKGLATAAALLHKKRSDWMLTGGEDYELLFTASPQENQKIIEIAARQSIRVNPVGIITEPSQGVVLQECGSDADREQSIIFQGFDHFT